MGSKTTAKLLLLGGLFLLLGIGCMRSAPRGDSAETAPSSPKSVPLVATTTTAAATAAAATTAAAALGILRAEEILRVHEAAITVGLGGNRMALLTGITPALAASLPMLPSPVPSFSPTSTS